MDRRRRMSTCRHRMRGAKKPSRVAGGEDIMADVVREVTRQKRIVWLRNSVPPPVLLHVESLVLHLRLHSSPKRTPHDVITEGLEYRHVTEGGETQEEQREYRGKQRRWPKEPVKRQQLRWWTEWERMNYDVTDQ